MHKKSFFCTLAVFLCLFTTVLASEKSLEFNTFNGNEPDGFKDMKWGSTIEELRQQGKDLTPTDPYSSSPRSPYDSSYILENDKELSGMTVRNIQCDFWHNKLYSCVVTVSRSDNWNNDFNTLLNSAIKRFGKPTEYLENEDETYAMWFGKTTSLYVHKFSFISIVTMIIDFPPLTLARKHELEKLRSSVDTSGW